jgi:3-oxoadipate enol-lactonase
LCAGWHGRTFHISSAGARVARRLSRFLGRPHLETRVLRPPFLLRGSLVALLALPGQLAAQAADTGFVAVAGGRIYYESVGTGPTVLLLHGGNLDHRMWDEQLPVLTPHFRVIRYDARGFGRSTPADTVFQAGRDLYSLLQHLAVPRVSLVGLSLGGRTAIDFALEHPEMVDRLVLAGPCLSGWRDWSAEDTTWHVRARRAGNAHDSIGMALAWLTSDYMRPAMEHPPLATRLRVIAAENARYWMGLFRQGDLEREPAPALGRLSAIRAPTLLLVGDRDSPVIRRIVDTLASTIPGSTVVLIRGAGHMVNMERPVDFNRAVLDFLLK